MTGMLASVTSVQEAKIMLNYDVDIIDIKDPSSGALGAQPFEQVRSIVESVKHKRLTSATIGDIQSNHENLYELIVRMSETGVDYVKVGLFSKQVEQHFLHSIKKAVSKGIAVVIVLFAEDYQEEKSLIPFLDIGLQGVMIDTRLKNGISLCDLLSNATIHNFICKAQSSNLLAGLAGSLKQENIPELLNYRADYLGFRGALCEANQRVKAISKPAVENICAQVKTSTVDQLTGRKNLIQAI